MKGPTDERDKRPSRDSHTTAIMRFACSGQEESNSTHLEHDNGQPNVKISTQPLELLDKNRPVILHRFVISGLGVGHMRSRISFFSVAFQNILRLHGLSYFRVDDSGSSDIKTSVHVFRVAPNVFEFWNKRHRIHVKVVAKNQVIRNIEKRPPRRNLTATHGPLCGIRLICRWSFLVNSAQIVTVAKGKAMPLQNLDYLVVSDESTCRVSGSKFKIRS